MHISRPLQKLETAYLTFGNIALIDILDDFEGYRFFSGGGGAAEQEQTAAGSGCSFRSHMTSRFHGASD